MTWRIENTKPILSTVKIVELPTGDHNGVLKNWLIISDFEVKHYKKKISMRRKIKDSITL